jgi:menaquinone-9 beta-reductase
VPAEHPSPRVDVLVVGAGPAGAAAAATLARNGAETLVVDRARFPRDKCCGDGLTVSALRELEALGLEPRALASWNEVDGAVLRSPSGRRIRFPLPEDVGVFATVVPRVELDAALVELARRAGAHLSEGSSCNEVDQDADGVTIGLTDGSQVRARYLIGADGAWSPVRRMAGLPRPDARAEWHAQRQYFDRTGPAARDLHVWFDADLLPGYAWSFPLPGGRANVGFGIARGGAYAVGDMAQLWRELLVRPHIREVLGPDAIADGPVRAWPIPARIDRTPLATGRVLFVGDAAAAPDVLTGEGIGQALLTGRWAAEAILAAGPEAPDDAERRYRASVSRELVPDHRISRLLVQAMAIRSGATAAIALAGASPWTRRNFARWLFEDYPRALITTPGRWHRGAFSGPGAFRHGSNPRNAPATSAR